MRRSPAKAPRALYSFRLDPDNVEKVRAKVPDLPGWVDEQFRKEVNAMEWSDQQTMVWKRWLASLNENVRAVAKAFPPTKTYRIKGDSVTGRRYIPRSYDEVGGEVSMTCDTFVGDGPKESVYGIKPENIEPA